MEKIFDWIADNWDRIVALIDKFVSLLVELTD